MLGGDVASSRPRSDPNGLALRRVPTRYDCTNGCNGQTYDNVVTFCALSVPLQFFDDNGDVIFKNPLQMSVPVQDRLPRLLCRNPYGDVVDYPHGGWAPMSNAWNNWVQVGNRVAEIFVMYMSAHHVPLEFGATRGDDGEITYAVCCDTRSPSIRTATMPTAAASMTKAGRVDHTPDPTLYITLQNPQYRPQKSQFRAIREAHPSTI